MASAGLVLAAFNAGYRLPSAPNKTAEPNPVNTNIRSYRNRETLGPLPVRKGLVQM